jgi:superfamily II DNA or RNA helicase
MKKAVISNRIYLNRTKELHDELLKKLTYKLIPKTPSMPAEIYCDVTRINKDILTIPSGRVDLIPKDYEVVDKRTIHPVTFPQFNFILRESQQQVYDSATDNCIIHANPSWGKTFTAIAIATNLKQKTLVIVHTKFLMEQWAKEVKKCLNIQPGLIGGGKFNHNSPITIATIQTLKNKKQQLLKEFGTLIIDEAHHTPADVFKSIVDKFNARYKIGLTGTPWRKDGRHVLLGDYFGNIEFNPPDENRIEPTIIMVKSEIPLNSNNMIPWGLRLNELYDRHDYMELIINLSHIQAQKGHLVLTVADRVEFLKHCADVLEEDSMLIVGETEDRNFLKSNKSILFGSSKIFAEGVNIPQLSSLILGMPINNYALLTQLIGRIARVHEGKKDPQVLDIMLKGKTGQNQANKRIGFYMDHGYKVKHI